MPRLFLHQLRALAFAVGFFAGACGPGGASPVPQPPLAAIPLDHVVVRKLDGNGRGYPSLGKPGSVPGGARVRVTNLDNVEAPVEVISRSDGSFVFDFRANPGDELRFEWLTDTERSPPTDAIFRLDGEAPLLTQAARFECVQLSPGFLVQFEGERPESVSFDNSCGSPLRLANPRTRLSVPNFSVDSALPFDVASGAAVEVEVVFTQTAAGAPEDVLFLDLTSGTQTVRYPITLSAPP